MIERCAKWEDHVRAFRQNPFPNQKIVWHAQLTTHKFTKTSITTKTLAFVLTKSIQIKISQLFTTCLTPDTAATITKTISYRTDAPLHVCCKNLVVEHRLIWDGAAQKQQRKIRVWVSCRYKLSFYGCMNLCTVYWMMIVPFLFMNFIFQTLSFSYDVVSFTHSSTHTLTYSQHLFLYFIAILTDIRNNQWEREFKK